MNHGEQKKLSVSSSAGADHSRILKDISGVLAGQRDELSHLMTIILL